MADVTDELVTIMVHFAKQVVAKLIVYYAPVKLMNMILGPYMVAHMTKVDSSVECTFVLMEAKAKGPYCRRLPRSA